VGKERLEVKVSQKKAVGTVSHPARREKKKVATDWRKGKGRKSAEEGGGIKGRRFQIYKSSELKKKKKKKACSMG